MAADDIVVVPNPPPPTPPTPPEPPQLQTVNVVDALSNVIGTLAVPVNLDPNILNQLLAIYSAASVPLNLPLLSSYYMSATSSVTTSSANPSVIPGMSIVPTKGRYAIFFSGSISTGGASASGQFGIFVNSVVLPESNRPISCNLSLLGGLVSISLNNIGVGTYTGTEVYLDGQSTVDIRYNSTNGGTIGFAERTLMLIKVG